MIKDEGLRYRLSLMNLNKALYVYGFLIRPPKADTKIFHHSFFIIHLLKFIDSIRDEPIGLSLMSFFLIVKVHP